MSLWIRIVSGRTRISVALSERKMTVTNVLRSKISGLLEYQEMNVGVHVEHRRGISKICLLNILFFYWQ